jgi:hypothetical protein
MTGPNEPRPPRPGHAVGDEIGSDGTTARNRGTPPPPESGDTEEVRPPIERDHDLTIGTAIENESEASLDH